MGIHRLGADQHCDINFQIKKTMAENKFADYDLMDKQRRNQLESALLAEAWAIILKFKFFFAACMIISLAVGVIYVRTTPRKFMRTATILIKDAKKGTGITESQTFQDVLTLKSNSLENEVGIFKSRKLMTNVVERLNLTVSYRAFNLKKTELYSSSPVKVKFIDGEDKSGQMTIKLIGGNRILIKDVTINENAKAITIQSGTPVHSDIGSFIVNVDSSKIAGYDYSEVNVTRSTLKSAVSLFRNQLTVEVTTPESSLLSLYIVDENAKRAEDVLNTLIEAYKEDAIHDKNTVTYHTAKFIDERLTIIEKDLHDIDTEIEQFKREHKLTDLMSESEVFLQNSNKLENDGLSIENQMNMAEYIKSYLTRNSKNSDMIPASIGIADDGLESLILAYNEKVEKRNRLLANSSPDNPIIQDLDVALEAQRRSLVRAIDNVLTSLKLQVHNMNLMEQETMNKIADLPTRQKQLASIERQQKIKEELYLYLLNKKEENELQQTIAESNCKIVDSADGPSYPVSPDKLQVIIICFIVGLLVPSALLYLRSLFNTKVWTKDDFRNKLTIPFLGELPYDTKREEFDILLVKGSEHEHVNENLRMVRENMNFMLPQEEQTGCRVVQLISLNEDSGKTFVTTNLAANIAISSKRVIVLDVDLRKASLSHRLGLSTKNEGLSNYLTGSVDNIGDIIHHINVELCSFDLIPSGTIPPNPSELLKSRLFDDLIGQLKGSYDYILMDNPPYGLVVDSVICSRLVDQTIYIMRSGMFDKRLLTDLQELYDSGKFRNMGVVLNGVNFKKMSYRYRYKYGYGYGYGYHYGHKTKDKGLKRFCREFFDGCSFTGLFIFISLLAIGLASFLYFPDKLKANEYKSDSVVVKDTVSAVVPTDTLTPLVRIASSKNEENAISTPNLIIPKKDATMPEDDGRYFKPDSTSYKIIGTEFTYKLEPGEMLTKVSLRFYRTKTLWPYLVEHNRDVFENPNKILPGTILKIPRLEKKQ